MSKITHIIESMINDKYRYMFDILSEAERKGNDSAPGTSWEMEVERFGGGISWQSSLYPDIIVYATPFWEGARGIPVEISHDDGTVVTMRDVPFEPIYSPKKDVDNYMQLIARKVVPTVERSLK